MPFALAIIGIILLVAGVRNQQAVLFDLVKNDFAGPNNFIFWMVSIFAIGALGYIPRLKPISHGFLALVIVVLFLRRGTGFFAQLNTALGNTTTTLSPNVAGNNPLTTNPDVPVTNPTTGYPGLAALTPLGGIQ